MLKQLFLTLTSIACMQLAMPYSAYGDEVYYTNQRPDGIYNDNCCCQPKSCCWTPAALVGGAAVIAAAAGLITGKCVKNHKGKRGSTGPVGAGNKTFDVGNSITFTHSGTANVNIGPGGYIEIFAFVMQPDLSFVYVNEIEVTESGVVPFSIQYTQQDPEFGRWEVGYSFHIENDLGSTINLSNSVNLITTRLGANLPIQGLFNEQQIEIEGPTEEAQVIVTFPYFPVHKL